MQTFQNTTGALKVYNNNNFGMWPFQNAPKFFVLDKGLFLPQANSGPEMKLKRDLPFFEYFEFEYVDLLTPD